MSNEIQRLKDLKAVKTAELTAKQEEINQLKEQKRHLEKAIMDKEKEQRGEHSKRGGRGGGSAGGGVGSN